MKLVRVIIATFILVFFCFAALLYYKPSSIVVITKSCIERLLSSEAIKVKIDNIDIEKRGLGYLITLNKVFLQTNDQNLLELNDVKIIPDIEEFFKSLKITLNISIDNFEIVKNTTRLSSELFTIIYSNDLKDFSKTLDIKFKLSNLDKINLLQNADIRCSYKDRVDKRKLTNCSMFINNISSVVIKKASFKGDILKLDGAVKDIPIEFYKILEDIFPENNLIKFLQKNQITGNIINGEFKSNFNINEIDSGKITNGQITGNFNVDNMFFQYDNYFPPLKGVKANCSIDGDMVKLNIDNGYIVDTKIDGVIINIFWNEKDKSRIVIDGYARGQASDLVKFVKATTLSDLKNNLIDLSMIKGDATTKINIIIPFEKGIKNTYDISTKVTKVSFNLLKYLYITNGQIEGNFNGSSLEIKSAGTLNNCPYNMVENFDILQDKNILNVKVNISKKLNAYQLLEINSGNAVLKLDYVSKNKKVNLSLASDLSKMEFLIHYPTLYKPINADMNLTAMANYKNDKIDSFNIGLTNNKNVNINGKIIVQNSNFIYDFPQIKSEYNDFKLLYKTTNQLSNVQISGNEINLSKMNFDFLTSQQDKSNKSLTVKAEITNARMHNAIDIKNLKVNITCDKDVYQAFKLEGLLDEKDLNLNLSYLNGKEIWTLNTNNAGSFLKAINLFEKVEGGNLNIIFEKKLDGSNQKGNFLLKDFIVTDPPSITRLISITSLTGFLNSLGENKKITFAQFVGQFKKKQNNLWEIFYTKGEGNFFDFLLNGEVNSDERSVKISGLVIPHYFIGSIIKPIPILKDLSLALRTGLTKVNPLDMTFTKIFNY